MLEFKAGDKIKCIDARGTNNMTQGKVYTVTKVMNDGDPYVLNDVGAQDWWAARRFELVSEYLTPEQVLKALQDDPTKVEVKYGINGEFVSADTAHPITYVDITQGKWRFKPVPKTIDYYGTELPKPIDISDLDESTVVYIPQLHRNSVYSMEVWEVKRLPYYGGSLHFSTYADARLVLDTIRKPFKQ